MCVSDVCTLNARKMHSIPTQLLQNAFINVWKRVHVTFGAEDAIATGVLSPFTSSSAITASCAGLLDLRHIVFNGRHIVFNGRHSVLNAWPVYEPHLISNAVRVAVGPRVIALMRDPREVVISEHRMRGSVYHERMLELDSFVRKRFEVSRMKKVMQGLGLTDRFLAVVVSCTLLWALLSVWWLRPCYLEELDVRVNRVCTL